MNATKELIEATEYLLSQFGKQDHLCDYGARPRAEAALAAAKEEQASGEREWMNDWHRNMCKKSKPVLVRLIEQEREHADKLLRELAAKEERGKVLTMQDVMLACGELNKRERVAVQWVLDRCRPVKEWMPLPAPPDNADKFENGERERTGDG